MTKIKRLPIRLQLAVNSSADRFIIPPQRVSKFDGALIVAMAALFAALPLLSRSGIIAIVVGTTLLTLVSAGRRSRPAVHFGLFCTLCLAVILCLAVALPGISYPQLSLSLSIVLYAAVVRTVPWLRGTVGWTRRGAFGWEIRLLCLGCALLAGVALLTWFVILRPDVDDLLQAYLPHLSPWLLIVGGVLFSMVNAANEEVVYRGVIMHAHQATFGPGVLSLLIQAMAFGISHINGFPRGWIGVGLACIYGVMMGVIRLRAKGMFAPWLAHVLTDVTIVCIMVFLARG
jgi:uncharacterized protein